MEFVGVFITRKQLMIGPIETKSLKKMSDAVMFKNRWDEGARNGIFLQIIFRELRKRREVGRENAKEYE